MIRIFASLLRQMLFWLLFFALNRAVFLIYYSHLVSIENPGFSKVLGSFWYGLRVDISTACYILLLPFILTLISSLLRLRLIDLINKIYTSVMVIIYALITTGELGIYGEWKTKLHYKALHYMSNPDEVYNSAGTGQFFWLLLIFIFLALAGIFAYHRFFFLSPVGKKRNYFATVVFFIITPALLFLGIRGGIQAIPITQSQSYYTTYNILNNAAVNSGYSFAFSWMENYRFLEENPYLFYGEDEANEIVKEIYYTPKDTTINILNTKRPNIVILLMESWSADLIFSLGGEEGITPEFEKLADSGILFTQMYASGNRSEQAMSSLFAGFPATPITAITHSPDKVVKLPSLPERMKQEDYYTSFYFGGHLMYGGIKSYIAITGFEQMMEIYDFPNDIPRGKLGVHDEFVFDYQIKDLDQMQQPFFSVVFTLSTHSPYDQPMEKVLDWGGSENQYINSAYYTDHCLKDYFEKAENSDWYDSTLFIIVADHSHNSYRHWPVTAPQYRHIPMLLYGNVINKEYRGSTIDRLSSQTDIPATLLKQLGQDTKGFDWSRDLFNPTSPEFVFYEATNGLGWMRPEGNFVWDRTYGFLEMNIALEHQDSLVQEGKAYLQVLFQEFMDY